MTVHEPLAEVKALVYTRTVHAPLEKVYNAFLSRDTLYYWLCEDAHVRAEVGGHIVLLWGNGEDVIGRFKTLEKNRRIVFSWHEPDGTEAEVDAQFEEHGGSIVITLEHKGDFLPKTMHQREQDWEQRLNNLVSYLETGVDLRLTERVIIGIFPDFLDAEKAAHLGITVTEGMLVTGLVPGFSAEAAGMQVNDAIVLADGKPVTRQSGGLSAGKKPGDVVAIEFYRGSEQHQAQMTLRGYPIPPTPADFKALADHLEPRLRELDQELITLLADVTDAEAEQRPAENEWNSKEVLAHLILAQRWLQDWLGGFLQGPEVTGYTANALARVAGLVVAYPTLGELQAELSRSYAETLGILRAFPADALERRHTLWWTTFEVDGIFQHTRQHYQQIQANLTAARG
jgi:uncharacterized protein YndB with AHSA1/START domain